MIILGLGVVTLIVFTLFPVIPHLIISDHQIKGSVGERKNPSHLPSFSSSSWAKIKFIGDLE